MTQVVVARLAGLTGRAAELRQLLSDRARDAHTEDGCSSYEVDELLATPSEVVLHQVASTTRASASTSPTDPGRFG